MSPRFVIITVIKIFVKRKKLSFLWDMVSDTMKTRKGDRYYENTEK